MNSSERVMTAMRRGQPEIIGDTPDPGCYRFRIWSLEKGKRIGHLDKPSDRFLGHSLRVVHAADLNGDRKDEITIGLDSGADRRLIADRRQAQYLVPAALLSQSVPSLERFLFSQVVLYVQEAAQEE